MAKVDGGLLPSERVRVRADVLSWRNQHFLYRDADTNGVGPYTNRTGAWVFAQEVFVQMNFVDPLDTCHGTRRSPNFITNAQSLYWKVTESSRDPNVAREPWQVPINLARLFLRCGNV